MSNGNKMLKRSHGVKGIHSHLTYKRDTNAHHNNLLLMISTLSIVKVSTFRSLLKAKSE